MTDLTAIIAAHLYEPRRYQYLRDCSCGWKSGAGQGAQTLDYASHVAAAIEESYCVREEWEVTGHPGGLFPTYRFVFGNPHEADRAGTPEQRARDFASLVACNWLDGPHLRSRRILESEWTPDGDQ